MKVCPVQMRLDIITKPAAQRFALGCRERATSFREAVVPMEERVRRARETVLQPELCPRTATLPLLGTPLPAGNIPDGLLRAVQQAILPSVRLAPGPQAR